MYDAERDCACWLSIQDYFGGYYNTSQVLNNLIYANSDAGIVVATPYGSGSPLITSTRTPGWPV